MLNSSHIQKLYKYVISMYIFSKWSLCKEDNCGEGSVYFIHITYFSSDNRIPVSRIMKMQDYKSSLVQWTHWGSCINNFMSNPMTRKGFKILDDNIQLNYFLQEGVLKFLFESSLWEKACCIFFLATYICAEQGRHNLRRCNLLNVVLKKAQTRL